MKKKVCFTYILFILSGVVFNSCFVVNGKYWDVRDTGEAINPTELVFDFPISIVRGMIDSCFNVHVRGAKHLRFKGYYGGNIRSGALELNYSGDKKSYVYKNRKGEYLSICITPTLLVDSLDQDHTLVRMKAKKHSIVAGKRFVVFNPERFSVWAMRYKGKESTTIEEYEILYYLGKRLGQTGMPPICYPKALTLEEVKSRFPYFPFTMEDLKFGK